MTPDDLRAQLHQVGLELRKAAGAIESLEVEAERAELDAQACMDGVYLTAEGSVEDRKALARQECLGQRDGAVVARAGLNRARMKAKHLELEQMRLMALLKSVQAEGA